MRDDLTVIYYTSQREKSVFEERIKKTLLDTIGDLPLISVSHRPMDFGKNICVGEHEASSQNAFRQFQIGAKEAKTKFVCPAESDFIYPKEYFEFVPEREDTGYLAIPVWVLFAQRGYGKVFVRKDRGGEGAMVVGRNCLINGIEKQLKPYGMWGDKHCDGTSFQYLLKIIRHDYFYPTTPLLTFKTDNNMHKRTPFKTETKCRELEPFGNAREFVTKYMG